MDNQNRFCYTYSAREQEEIKNIRKKYTGTTDKADKMATLRKLDAQVESRAVTAALVVGILGALVLAAGILLIVAGLGQVSGAMVWLVLGILIGLVGTVLVCLAYPVYIRTLKKERERVAPEILRLTDELMQ